MSHRHGRLAIHGRRLLVERVRIQGMPVVHVAKAMGVSRKGAHRWVGRFDLVGFDGLEDRSSRPHSMPRPDDGDPDRRGTPRAARRSGATRVNASTDLRTLASSSRVDPFGAILSKFTLQSSLLRSA